jgi:cyclase
MSLSRRTFLAFSAVSAAGGALLHPARVGALSRHDSSRQDARGTFTSIRRNVGFFTLRGGTVGYLVNDDGVAVVDSQFPDSAAVLVAGLDERSGGRPVDCLVNTHHHGDHTGGNPVFQGVARTVVAHEAAVEHMRNPPGGQPPADPHLPDQAFSDRWSLDLGDERVTAVHRGRAHTSGDAVVTFEQANVAHMGDLMFHRRHPVVDRAAGATLRGWIEVLEGTVDAHARDTVYVFGHAGSGLPVTGTFTDLLRFRDYLDAALAWVAEQQRAGRSRDEVLALRDPLPGFEDFGPFGQPGAREIRTCAWEELGGD